MALHHPASCNLISYVSTAPGASNQAIGQIFLAKSSHRPGPCNRIPPSGGPVKGPSFRHPDPDMPTGRPQISPLLWLYALLSPENCSKNLFASVAIMHRLRSESVITHRVLTFFAGGPSLDHVRCSFRPYPAPQSVKDCTHIFLSASPVSPWWAGGPWGRMRSPSPFGL